MVEIKGRCAGLNDPAFSFGTKSTSAYDVKVNFQCLLEFNKTKLVEVDMVVSYEVSPQLSSKYLDFVLSKLTGSPQFTQSGPFKIEYP
jgi:hypothetical protein